jgi:hypothetical protein
MTRPKVVITGVGLVTALGQDRDEVWGRLPSGADGISPVKSFDTSRFRVHRGGEVKAFRPVPPTGRCDPTGMGRTSHFAVTEAVASLRDGGFDAREELGDLWGICLGTTLGESREIEEFDDRELAGESDPGAGRALLALPLFHNRRDRGGRVGCHGRRLGNAGGVRSAHLRDRPRRRRAAGGADRLGARRRSRLLLLGDHPGPPLSDPGPVAHLGEAGRPGAEPEPGPSGAYATTAPRSTRLVLVPSVLSKHPDRSRRHRCDATDAVSR